MKKQKLFVLLLCAAAALMCIHAAGKADAQPAAALPPPTLPAPTTGPTTLPPETTDETLPPIVIQLTEEERQMLLKIGMAELGHTECEICIALVMRTVLNRLEAGGYGNSIYGVLHAKDQFTPVMDGSYGKAEPNDACSTALELVIRGWDESQGALFYEFCEGESWHSQNLELLTEHCNTRFYK